jgi:hypothetical protein
MHELTEKDYKKVHDVMRLFNFKQASEILKFIHDNYMDKVWDGISEPDIPFIVTCEKVPSADELEDLAWNLLTSVIKEELQYTTTGWLRAEKIKFTDYPNDYELGLYLDTISIFEEPE